MAERLRILGIDPGSRLTGFGVIDFVGDKGCYVASGSIESAKGEFSDRLKIIFRSVSDIVDEYRPDIVAIESVFVHKSAGSAFYEAILAGLPERPERWIVVDDYAEPLAAASSLGAATVGIGANAGDESSLRLSALAELPARIDALL